MWCTWFSACTANACFQSSCLTLFFSDTISMGVFRAVGAIKPGAADCSSTEVWPSSGKLRGDWDWRVQGETPHSWDSKPASLAPVWLIGSSWAQRSIAMSCCRTSLKHLSVTSKCLSLHFCIFFPSDVPTASTFHPLVSYSLSAPPLLLSSVKLFILSLSFISHILYTFPPPPFLQLAQTHQNHWSGVMIWGVLLISWQWLL